MSEKNVLRSFGINLAHQDDPRVAVFALTPFVVAWVYFIAWAYMTEKEELFYSLLAFAGVFTFSIGGARSVVQQFFPQRMIVARRQSPDFQARINKPGWREKLSNNDHLVPQMNIVIMITGTHGDVAPFVALGLELNRRYGHRIRMATHSTHRDYVTKQGMEFYPLAGDPKVLSQWMVESHGRVLPNLLAPMKELQKELTELVPQKMAMVNAIMESTWAACVDSLPDGSPPFVAHAIISNPVAYGHIHCASALNIPLHMAFPQPWTPTGEYPHPFMIPNSGLAAPKTSFARMANRRTYFAFDELTWMGLNASQWRTRILNLSPLQLADGGGHILNDLEVPFAYMWSPDFVPKPPDWGAHIDVVGTLVHDKGGTGEAPNEEIVAFLSKGEPPIFIGFGSMVIGNLDELYAIIVEAATKADVRIVVQSSWSKLGGDGVDTPDNVFCIGNCSHAWLLPQCSACIHHGGAGTVAAGLRVGLPTFIVPFFGDQHFWGEMVRRAGAGPAPCPYPQLTTWKLVEAIETLLSEPCREKARELSVSMLAEDGIGNMCDTFTRHLPVESMVCMVSLFADTEPRIVVAEKWHMQPQMQLSAEAHAALQDSPLRTWTFMDYGYICYDPHAPSLGKLAQLPLNGLQQLRDLGLVALSPLFDFWDTVSEFFRSSSRSLTDIACSSIFILVFSIVELPVRLVAQLAVACFWCASTIVQLVMTCTFGRFRRNVVQVRARHPGIRRDINVATIPQKRRDSLVKAAVHAEHVLACVALVQRRRRGNLKPWLSRAQMVEVLAILITCKAPGSITHYRSQCVVARMRRRWALYRMSKDVLAKARELVDKHVEGEGMGLVDFCLKAGDHVNQKMEVAGQDNVAMAGDMEEGTAPGGLPASEGGRDPWSLSALQEGAAEAQTQGENPSDVNVAAI